MSKIIETLESVLPEILWRSNWDEYKAKFGIPFSKGTLQNWDSEGRGPEKSLIAGKVCYLKQDFLNWLSTQLPN